MKKIIILIVCFTFANAFFQCSKANFIERHNIEDRINVAKIDSLLMNNIELNSVYICLIGNFETELFKLYKNDSLIFQNYDFTPKFHDRIKISCNTINRDSNSIYRLKYKNSSYIINNKLLYKNKMLHFIFTKKKIYVDYNMGKRFSDYEDLIN